ncbi:hypothetical protein BH09BAC5_BH09BAC5_06630 [soil metagenome]
MNTKRIFISGLMLFSFLCISAQTTFQKNINLTNNATYPGLFGDGIGYDATTGSIFIQTDQHDGCCGTPPGVMKLDTNGNILWSRFINASGSTWGASGTAFNGGFSVLARNTGSTGSMTSAVINYDGAGNLVSSTGINTNASSVVDLNIVNSVRLPNGDMLATGYGPVNGHYKDIFYCRLNSTGNIIWGGYSGDYDSYWENGWGADQDPVTLDCYFVGQNISFSQTNSTDIHIIKTDINGNVLYTKNIATPFTDIGYCVKVLPNQDVVLIGTTTNNSSSNEEITFIKLTPAGNLITSCKYQATSNTNIIRNVNILPDGNLLLTGYTNSFGAGGLDALLMEVDLSGNIIWQKSYGSTDDDHFINSVVVNNSIFSVGATNVGNSTGAGFKVFLVKSNLTGGFSNPACPVTNGTFVRTAETYTFISAMNITPSGFNIVSNFTEPSYTNANVDICISSNPVTATASVTNVNCFGSCNGSAIATPSGGTSPYSYSWSPSGGNAATASSLCAGSYTCTITDASSATTTVSVLITEPPVISAIPSQSNVTCNASCNGSANVIASGGNGSYTYSWSPSGGTSATASSLCAGSYTCTISSPIGCDITQSFIITEPPVISAIPSQSNVTCNASCNGSATVIASGGNGSYTYSWSPSGGTSATASGLCAGTYTCTISSPIGCDITQSFTITEPPVISAIPSQSNITCNAACNGSATVIASGGNGTYTYSWSPSGGTSATASGLCPGTYSCTISSPSGCDITQSFTITEPPPLVTNPIFTPATCGNNNGAANPQVSGGTGPYTYNWSNAQTSPTLSNLAAGIYTLTITDANGCSTTASFNITNTGAPLVSVSSFSDVTCFGASSGSASVVATSGSAPYTYSWSPTGGTNSSASNLSAGTYTVTVTGSDGCITTQTVAITQPTSMADSINSTAENCGASDGSASVIVNGGTPGYTYTWNTGDTTSTISNLTSGLYSTVITDANGCVITATVNVGSASTATADAGTFVTIISGSTTILIGTGNGNTYSWSPSNDLSCNTCQNPVASPTVTTTYTLTVTDSLGCTATDTVTVFVDILCGTIYLPTAFSPNHDGQNDIYYVRGNCIETLQFEIFNRWGEMVFFTDDITRGWDGTWRDKQCEPAVFTYFIRATLLDGSLYEGKGNISIVK